jgi:hypothetical protein
VTIAGTTFEHHHYDERGDVLYLSVTHHQGHPLKRYRRQRVTTSNTTAADASWA